ASCRSLAWSGGAPRAERSLDISVGDGLFSDLQPRPQVFHGPHGITGELDKGGSCITFAA
ncbi:MAG: hypothetical protein K0R61_4992, partial [Microvirga sp.]|nr:hypothetical protein [Microvirga sp.]